MCTTYLTLHLIVKLSIYNYVAVIERNKLRFAKPLSFELTEPPVFFSHTCLIANEFLHIQSLSHCATTKENSKPHREHHRQKHGERSTHCISLFHLDSYACVQELQSIYDHTDECLAEHVCVVLFTIVVIRIIARKTVGLPSFLCFISRFFCSRNFHHGKGVSVQEKPKHLNETTSN